MPKIVHISDIHTFNDKRHDEYRLLFTNTIEKVRILKPDFALIDGDIFNSNCTTSPESTVLNLYLVEELAKICKVILIPGNHDGNVRNLSRINCVQMLYDILKDNPNVIYFGESGLFDIGNNVMLGVFSIYGERSEWVTNIENKDPNKTYIAVFHGPLLNVGIGHGMKLKSDLSVGLFSEYDYALFGDIHVRQFLDPRTVEIEIDESEIEDYKYELDFEVVN